MREQRSTRIVLDEEKILREGKYNLNELYEYLDKTAKEAGLIKQDKQNYLCRGDKEDLTCLGIFTIFNVLENEAITTNLKEWFWLIGGREESDIMEDAKESGRGIW